MKDLRPLINIDDDKCLNCHQCIAACPVKFANDGSKEVVTINHNLCIGCGACIAACTHSARTSNDNLTAALNNLKSGKHKMVAIVAPAIASVFEGRALQFNGWLKSMGVDACFDVSLGAELTVKSYLEYITKAKPDTVIAQPCPAIVTFIQTYAPELIPLLAPADSPMLHTMKMVREFHPEYKNHKFMVISPCIAKGREFDETGLGDYNVTMTSIKRYLEQERISIADFPAADFDGIPAERAVLFSTPGGLLETAEREFPNVKRTSRKIEGVNTIYHYLRDLKQVAEKGIAPLIVDCLNCEMGCNGGTGTPNHNKPVDELEYLVDQRRRKHQEQLQTDKETPENIAKYREQLLKLWKDGLYNRTYANHSENWESVKTPSPNELEGIFKSMHKHTEDDIKNCASCGYNDCNDMAKAIHNGFNRKENCHFFMSQEIEELNRSLDLKVKVRTEELEERNQQINQQQQQIIKDSEELLHIIDKVQNHLS